MKQPLTIVKIGGAIVDDERTLASFIDAFYCLHGHKILVHGGGKLATALATRLGIEVTMVDGRRVTDDDMIDIATMTYAGLINKRVVSLLQKNNLNGIGLTGVDGNSILSAKRPVSNGMDYGWVGDIKKINTEFLIQLLATGMLPVIAPITHDGDGHLLNTNADTIASEVAIALSSQYHVCLHFIFGHRGVMKDINDDASLIRQLDKAEYEVLKEQGVIHTGMIPKLDNAFAAIDQGVNKIRLSNIAALSQLNNPQFDEYTTLY